MDEKESFEQWYLRLEAKIRYVIQVLKLITD